MSAHANRSFPFSAIVGQETLKLALLLVAVDPGIGGVLVSGHKGTAKSTAVRALPGLLPAMGVVDGCRFGCDPDDDGSWCAECRERSASGSLAAVERPPALVELPVSATEDRLLGTFDLEHALRAGEKRFEPGLLARANRGILYVDEVNLLDDHLVDALLDVAASGVNTVEREGVAMSHPARFVLVGTMNPEEGEIRPQLLDRFGLSVAIEGIADPESRVEIVRRRGEYEADAAAFAGRWADAEARLAKAVGEARDSVGAVTVSDDLLYLVASICAELAVEGHRADITIARAAAARAALEGRDAVTEDDIRTVAPLVLGHRTRRAPAIAADAAALARAVTSAAGSHAERAGREAMAAPIGDARQAYPAEPSETAPVGEELGLDLPRSTGETRPEPGRAGRRDASRAADTRGRYVTSSGARPASSSDVALDATLRAAAANGPAPAGTAGPAIRVEASDLRSKVRSRRNPACILFCVDASGSMGVSTRMEAAKAAVLDLLVDAYQHRDRVGLVSFRGDRAELVLSPTASVELARMRLAELRTGGPTPLAHGIATAIDTLERERRRDPEIVPWLVLLTDGRANVGLGGSPDDDARAMAGRLREQNVRSLVVDTGSGGVARDVADLAGGSYVRLNGTDAVRLSATIRGRVG